MSDIISHLISGVSDFSKKECTPNSLYNQTVARGQNAKVMVIGCSDSLVDPLLLTGAKAGELFIHRNIAALIPKYREVGDKEELYCTSSALEHGVNNLEVEHLIILGHACCGGIGALLKNDVEKKSGSFIQSWVKIALSAKHKILQEHKNSSDEEKRHLCEKESIKISLANLMTFPSIQKRVVSGKLKLHGWYFDRGELSIYNQTEDSFKLAF